MRLLITYNYYGKVYIICQVSLKSKGVGVQLDVHGMSPITSHICIFIIIINALPYYTALLTAGISDRTVTVHA